MVTTYIVNSKTTSTKKKSTLITRSAKLGWILVNKKFISQSQLESALNLQFSQNKKLGELLLDQQLISREELELALKEQYWRRNGYWVI